MGRFDIRRQLKEDNTRLGGVSVTSTAIETRFIELQHLKFFRQGGEILRQGGYAIEADFVGYCHKDTNILEQDTITENSGTTTYQIVFVKNLYNEHLEVFAKKVT